MEAFLPSVVIVIPVYKHSVLVNDALRSALLESQTSNGAIVIVNDGCPFEETHDVCVQYCVGYPASVHYIKTGNSGLSAARNRGIKYALARFPSIQTVYLLDADNRLAHGAISRASKMLVETGADWLYPNIDKFGLEWNGDFSAPYSLLRHLFQNVSEAGSLVHRRIFDTGIYFDEGMRQGYEDWEFWLQCAEKGFRGRAYEDFGLEYRARRESMVRDSDREGAEILAYIHKKHKTLYTWKNLLDLEHREAPRYCVVDTSNRRYGFKSIPDAVVADESLTEVDLPYWRSALYSSRYHFPNFLMLSSNRILREMSRLHIIDWIFWQMEDLLQSAAFVYVVLVHVRDGLSFTVEDHNDLRHDVSAAHIVATHFKCLHECVLDPQTGWIDSLRSSHPQPPVRKLIVSGPFACGIVGHQRGGTPLSVLFDLFEMLRTSPWRQTNAVWEWRSQLDGLIPTRDLYLRTRSHMRAFAPLARCSTTRQNEVAFLLPVLSFGGVEQVAIQVAAQFRAAGWQTRVIVTERREVRAPARLLEAFDAICFLNDPQAFQWSPTGQTYYGQAMQSWETYGRIDRLVGLVAGCAAVINFQAQQGNGVMGWLRKQGIVTATSLHLFDRDALQAPVGHPYLTLAYEHAYDLITSPSHALLRSLGALGVPRAKLVHLPNAATFTTSEAMRSKRLEELAASKVGLRGRKLRVLSIGRLDQQKGVERLIRVIDAVRAQDLAVEWRIVGSAIIGDAAEAPTDVAGVPIEPPVYDRDRLAKTILWADVLILLSHWEGSPLIILEAQSLGVIPIATDVGGVGEMIDPDVDGVLIANGGLSQVVETTVDTLRRLEVDDGWRKSMARAACLRQAEASWERSARELINRVCERTRT